MNFDFICEKFFDYEIEHFEDYIYIKKQGFTEPIKIFYDLDMDEYTVCFATYHRHIDATAENVLIDTISAFATVKKATVAFYDNEQICFASQVETEFVSNITYDSIRKHFGYIGYDISRLTFQVYAWDKEYCFEGSFKKSGSNVIEIIKKY